MVEAVELCLHKRGLIEEAEEEDTPEELQGVAAASRASITQKIVQLRRAQLYPRCLISPRLPESILNISGCISCEPLLGNGPS